MRECQCKTAETCDASELLLKEHFPYIQLTLEGELVIPKDKVDDFVRRYSELSDVAEHQQQLRMYRSSGARKAVSESDD